MVGSGTPSSPSVRAPSVCSDTDLPALLTEAQPRSSKFHQQFLENSELFLESSELYQLFLKSSEFHQLSVEGSKLFLESSEFH